MDKILLIVDSNGIDKSAFEFACYVADLTRSTLSAIFLGPEPYTNHQGNKKLSSKLHNEQASIVDELPEENRKTQLAENQRIFALACANKGIRWTVPTTAIKHVHEIVSETRFADLLIVNAESHLSQHMDSPPTPFVKEILSKTECPVIIAPYDFSGIEEIVFAYDGSASSVFAIKQFTYLFPEYSKTTALFIQINEDEESNITDKEKIEGYLKIHYADVRAHVLHGKVGNELFASLLGKRKIFVVTGSYGRKHVSSIIKKSAAELLLKTTTLPVFIAHR